ncbi:hypothetical protein GCM10022199_22350 [Marihabitans asiaticum]
MGYQPFTSSSASMPTSIAGDGFIVRQPAESDAEALGELVGDPEHAAEVVASWVGHWEVDGYGSWVVEGADGALLGFVGVRPREEDIALTIRSSAAAAADGRAAAVLQLVVAHSLEWLPDAPLRLRVGADDPATQALAESAGLVHVEQQDHEAKGRRWHVLESPYPRSFSRLPRGATGAAARPVDPGQRRWRVGRVPARRLGRGGRGRARPARRRTGVRDPDRSGPDVAHGVDHRCRFPSSRDQ